jgi:hypothetical protein
MDFRDYKYYLRKYSKALDYRKLTKQAKNPEEITARLG